MGYIKHNMVFVNADVVFILLSSMRPCEPVRGALRRWATQIAESWSMRTATILDVHLGQLSIVPAAEAWPWT